MERNSFIYHGSDGTKIHAQSWVAATEPKAIVQVAHGMAEHIGRYEEFAKNLVEHELFVYGNDHRGHGKTAETKEELGYFADENGFEKAVEDLRKLTEIIENNHPGVPIFLFGHSMGSFLARRYIQLYKGSLAGVILSGTGGDPGFMGRIGTMIAAWESKKKGRKTPSPLLDKMSFGSFNKSFNPARTPFDWLSRDPIEVDKYIEDPLCGNVSTAGFFHDLFIGLQTINKVENINLIDKNLPIYLFSGDQDPVGNNTKGVLKTAQAYQAAGIKNVTYKFYSEGRHEMLNEVNRDEVYSDIIQWIEAHI